MELSNDKKYRRLDDESWDDFNTLQTQCAASQWRPVFHISPVCGLLNDPNGFCYFDGRYHLFYQWYPFGVAHGMKHWAHVTSPDLVQWSQPELAIVPEDAYDPRGAYSGAAFLYDADNAQPEMLLYYTGNLKYQDGSRDANQCVAVLDKDGSVAKSQFNPLIESVPSGYTGHVRDPKVLRTEAGYIMLLGAQRADETGCILIYKGLTPFDWQFAGELDVRFPAGDEPIEGYMWECPDYFSLDGKDVLIFSPQGIASSKHRFHNQFNVIYCIGQVDWHQQTFDIESWDELDRGFDFYAPQTMVNHPAGKRILSAWAGCGDPAFPSDKEGWSNCLTFPRELSLVNGKLYQRPVQELAEIIRFGSEKTGRHTTPVTVLDQGCAPFYYTKILLTSDEPLDCEIRFLEAENEHLSLHIDGKHQRLTLDRSAMHQKFAQQWGESRYLPYDIGPDITIEVLLDGSIAEIFIDGGREVFTARLFPSSDASAITLNGAAKMHFQYSKSTVNSSVALTPMQRKDTKR